MKYYNAVEVKEVYRVIKTVNHVECDVCKKHVGKRYFNVVTGHHDWGNDSHESIQYRDICGTCLSKFVSDYFSKATGTEYMDIETAYEYDGAESTIVDKRPEDGTLIKGETKYW